eukprot:jgi/Hompol1/797/HPOL_005417-RA
MQTGWLADPQLQDRWDVPINPALLRGVTILETTGADTNNALFNAWTSRFYNYINYVLTSSSALQYYYPDIDPNQRDPTAANYALNVLYTSGMSLSHVAGYEALMVVATMWNSTIAEHNTNGQALVNGSLLPYLTFEKFRQTYRQPNMSMVGLDQFTSYGTQELSRMRVIQLDGSYLGLYGPYTASFNINTTTGAVAFVPNASIYMMPGNRSFYDVPIDMLPPNESFLLWSDKSVQGIVAIAAFVALITLSSTIYIAANHLAPPITYSVGFGLTIVLGNVVTLIGKDKPIACAVRIWPVPFGLTIVLACMVIKGHLLYTIFSLSRTRLASFTTNLKERIVLLVPLFAFVTLGYTLTSVPKQFYFESVSTIFGVLFVWWLLLGQILLAHLGPWIKHIGRRGRKLRKALKMVAGVSTSGMESSQSTSEFSGDHGAVRHVNAEVVGFKADKPSDASEDYKSPTRSYRVAMGYILVGRFVSQWKRAELVLFIHPTFTIRWCLNPESIMPEMHFLSLDGLKSIRSESRGTGKYCEHSCKMEFESTTLLLQFSKASRMEVWTDAVARAVLAVRAPDDKRALMGESDLIRELQLTRKPKTSKTNEEHSYLGDQYLRDEYARHRTASPEYVAGFIKGWTAYRNTLSEQLDKATLEQDALDRETERLKNLESIGAKMNPSDLDNFTPEQIGQLFALKEAARNKTQKPDSGSSGSSAV